VTIGQKHRYAKLAIGGLSDGWNASGSHFLRAKRKKKKCTGDWVKAHIWLNRCLAIWLRQRPPAVFHFSFIFLEGGGCQPTAQTN